MQERIIILGAGVMQGPAIKIAKELGFFTVVVDGSCNAPCISMADHFEHIDLKDKEGIEAFARSLQNSGGLGGIMTAGTDFSATVSWVAERLGLPGIPYEAALNASDKTRMRSCFKKAGVPSPDFAALTKENCGKLPWLPFPLVVKPVDNMGGRGCRLVNGADEFRDAAEDALRFSRSGRAIAETFMDGPEFSVDAIVYHGEIIICGLADRHIFFQPYFIEMGHTMPADVTSVQQESLLETFCAGVRALGLAGPECVGAAKGDIKLSSKKGAMIGEIAARLSGGYMSGWTYPYSSGVEPIRAAILAAMGRKPDGLEPLKNWCSAERAFISIPGTVKAISGTASARGLPCVQDLFLRAAIGDKVDFPRNNVSKCGNIISASPDRAGAIEAAEAAARSILIRLETSDSETSDFLAKSDTFPPDAYQLTPPLKAELSALPETEACSIGVSVPVLSFPAFTESGLKDYVGRTVKESLKAICELTGLSLVFFDTVPEMFVKNGESSDNRKGKPRENSISGDSNGFLGKSFWAALARGGYQGAVYYVDCLRRFRTGTKPETNTLP